MRILCVGGGSGGHVTPVIAVMHELRQQSPDVQLRFWVDRGFASQARAAARKFDSNLRTDVIISGKLRRYHHVALWRQLFWPSVVIPNIIDGFKVCLGTLQSFCKLVAWRPDVVFAKGGFVCLPVGWAAALLRIPIILHDSDAHPGLTNRILARYASAIGTGAPTEYYHYPKPKMTYVGIPVSARFQPVTPQERLALKRELGFSDQYPLVVVTGGGLGATRINQAVYDALDDLRAVCSVALVSGSANYDLLKGKMAADDDRFKLYDFVDNMPDLLRAADLAVARAGATTLAELAAIGIASIIIPNARLTGGHQQKNAAVYAENSAVVVLEEAEITQDSLAISRVIRGLLAEPSKLDLMRRSVREFAKPNAARDMAQLIVSAAGEGR